MIKSGIKVQTPITAAYGGQIRFGVVTVNNHYRPALIHVHFRGAKANPSGRDGVRHDGGTWADIETAHEGITWVRGTFEPDSDQAKALLVAAALS